MVDTSTTCTMRRHQQASWRTLDTCSFRIGYNYRKSIKFWSAKFSEQCNFCCFGSNLILAHDTSTRTSFQQFGIYSFKLCVTRRLSLLTVEMCQRLAKANPHHEVRYACPKMSGLPDPNTSLSTDVAKMAASFESVTSAVDEAILKTTSRTSKEDGQHFNYDKRKC